MKLRDLEKRVLADSKPTAKVDITKWHSMRIVARGNKLEHHVDGKLAVEIVGTRTTGLEAGCEEADLAAHGMTLHAVFTLADLLERWHDAGRIDRGTRDDVIARLTETS